MSYPVRFAVDYPDRSRDRLTSALRIFTAIGGTGLLGPAHVRHRRPAGRSENLPAGGPPRGLDQPRLVSWPTLE
jgi:hypothetical protein